MEDTLQLMGDKLQMMEDTLQLMEDKLQLMLCELQLMGHPNDLKLSQKQLLLLPFYAPQGLLLLQIGGGKTPTALLGWFIGLVCVL